MSIITQSPSVQSQRRPAAVAHSSWGALAVILAGIVICTLDFFIVNVALPATQSDLHASPSQSQFVVAGYGLALAAGLITAGRLGDLYGRRRLLTIGTALFTAASAACGLAPTGGFLVAARVVQGASAALLMPLLRRPPVQGRRRRGLDPAAPGRRLARVHRGAGAHQGVSDEIWAKVREHYDDDQIANNRLDVIACNPGVSYQPGEFASMAN